MIAQIKKLVKLLDVRLDRNVAASVLKKRSAPNRRNATVKLTDARHAAKPQRALTQLKPTPMTMKSAVPKSMLCAMQDKLAARKFTVNAWKLMLQSPLLPKSRESGKKKRPPRLTKRD